jgi:ATP-dependent Clp protease ATP-binding subunit ClpA
MLTRGSLGCQILQDLDLTPQLIEQALKALSPSLPKPPEEVLNADELNVALSLAADESAWFGHHYIGTGHLLLGITRMNVGNARALLRNLDISLELIRRYVRNALSDGISEPDLQLAKRNARLSELSRRVINAAEQLAVTLDHPTIGLGHLLLVLLLEERSSISGLLRSAGLDESRLRHDLDTGDPVLIASLEPVLDHVLDTAQRMGSHYTGTEHLLLTLIADENGTALLRRYGIKPASLRHHLESQANRRTGVEE